MRHATALLCAILSAAPAAGQTAIMADSAPSTRPAEPRPQTVRLKVRPAAEPLPALVWQLLPEYLDQRPGNGAQFYYLADRSVPSHKAARERNGKVDEWLRTPPEKLPRKEAAAVVASYGLALRQLELAARREHCLWDMPIRSEGYHLAIPAMGNYRTLAKVLCLQARLHVAEGRHDKAIHELQTGFGMARHLAAGPTLVHSLVAAAIASLMLEQVDTLIQSPGVPNLYWALTVLPRPFVDLRASMEYERSSLYLAYPQLRRANLPDLTERQWQAVLDDLDRLLGSMSAMQPAAPTSGPQGGPGPATSTRKGPERTPSYVEAHPRARKFLIAQGGSPEAVQAMPVHRAVAYYWLDGHDRVRDETYKWFHVPYWQAQAGAKRAGHLLREAAAEQSSNTFIQLVAFLSRAYFLTTKLDRRIATLRCAEAVRMHAAAHDGNPPAELDEIRLVPAPLDPMTGKPFGYKVVGSTVTLTGPAPAGHLVEDEQRYELTFSKE